MPGRSEGPPPSAGKPDAPRPPGAARDLAPAPPGGGESGRLRERFLGIEESFSVKSYYPELRARLRELEAERSRALEGEARLAKLNAELELIVERRTAALRAANEDLARTVAELEEARDRVLTAEKLAAVGRAVAGIAHELNTPIGAIAASVRSSRRALSSELPALLEAWPGMGEEERAWLSRLLAAGAAGRRDADCRDGGSARLPDPGEERSRRAALAEALSRLPAEPGSPLDRRGPAALAEELVELGLGAAETGAVPFLGRSDGRAFLESLRTIGGLLLDSAVTRESCARAERVVEALRHHGRPFAEEAPVAVDPGSELAALVSLHYPRPPAGLSISLDCPPGLLVLARREDFRRILLNLLSNAVQAAGSRGAGGAVRLSALSRGDRAVVAVEDDGPGIPAEHRVRVFEPFFTTKREGEGTGLGLDIARRLAEANGGAISFESRPGQTRFELELPAAPRPAAGRAPSPGAGDGERS